LRQQDFCIIAFVNTHAAIGTQKALETAGLQAHIMPTPREITAGCSLSLRFPPERYAEAKRAMETLDFPKDYCHFYRMTYDDQHRQVISMEDSLS
jgi:hypothetical protein